MKRGENSDKYNCEANPPDCRQRDHEGEGEPPHEGGQDLQVLCLLHVAEGEGPHDADEEGEGDAVGGEAGGGVPAGPAGVVAGGVERGGGAVVRAIIKGGGMMVFFWNFLYFSQKSLVNHRKNVWEIRLIDST